MSRHAYSFVLFFGSVQTQTDVFCFLGACFGLFILVYFIFWERVLFYFVFLERVLFIQVHSAMHIYRCFCHFTYEHTESKQWGFMVTSRMALGFSCHISHKVKWTKAQMRSISCLMSQVNLFGTCTFKNGRRRNLCTMSKTEVVICLYACCTVARSCFFPFKPHPVTRRTSVILCVNLFGTV